ncbi:MAG: hypothetical protein COT84_06550 [Chlamydiae bacterium CG10_big_fil_rev_8_21_14_0_10_35_9]|nr:MAG: hypothetical protein COT84_06550 [Chlamydiae bacterium CG10_big_fil_rev_8_21_14_0_10_35_9]
MKKIHYLIQNPLLKIPLKIVDSIGYKFFSKRKSTSTVHPKRILISNIAHLGDAIIFSAIIPILKSQFPNADLGILIGSWAKEIFSEHPGIKWIHFLDHWKLNRASISLIKKMKRHFFIRRKTIKEIQRINYDLSIDFYPFFPNTSYVLWKGNVPIRLGYNSAGLGFLFTSDLNWHLSDRFILEYHMDLLKLLNLKKPFFKAKPLLKPLQDDILIKIKNKTSSSFLGDNYIVLHSCSGNPMKEWPENYWIELVNKLQFKNASFLFTGKGKRESQRVAKIIPHAKNCYNLVDQLLINEFFALIAKAKLLICSDSLPVHIAWAYDTPSIVIQQKTLDASLWSPPNPNCFFLRKEQSPDYILSLSSTFIK